MVALVQLEIKAKGLNKPFTYLIPTELKKSVAVGKRVLVPFGPREIAGFIVSLENNHTAKYELKPIIKILDEDVILNDELSGIVDLIVDNTLCNKSKVIETILPKGLHANHKTNVTRKYKNIVKLKVTKEKLKDYLEHNTLGYQQTNLLNELLTKEEIDKSSYAPSSYKRLVKDNIISFDKAVVDKLRIATETDYPKHELNDEQNVAYQKIASNMNTAKTYLLYGVTGSGKTEVYLHLIEKALSAGKSAIVLVPEISLTPQTTARFLGRFKTGVITLHSRMTNQERLEAWQRIKSGEIKVVIGPRSAIFAPFDNLGIIIIDEEHEGTYKQQNNPKYHTLDVAKYRSEYHNIPLVLGSATPSLDTMARASKGVYELLPITTRINKSMPEVIIVDKTKFIAKRAGISELLIDKIEERLEKKEQVILFLNRRGFSTISSCQSCGFTLKCPHCDITLTYHKNDGYLKCHYCSYQEKNIKTCSECNSDAIRSMGMGTQRIEENLANLFPEAKIIRMDHDTTRSKGAHHQLINTMDSGDADILVGTQMIAKGLDFKRVTLVGVINADLSLNMPDFRSAERTFSLLTQVAGRSGRDELKGEVIIETFNPDHYVIKNTKKHDYLNFFKDEMKMRRTLSYPPYYYLALIKFSSMQENIAKDIAEKVTNVLKNNLNETHIVLGPAKSNMYKLHEVYYYQTLIKYKSDKQLKETLKVITKQYETDNHINIDIDINPSMI